MKRSNSKFHYTSTCFLLSALCALFMKCNKNYFLKYEIMPCSTFTLQNAAAFPSMHFLVWQFSRITVAFSPLRKQHLHAVRQQIKSLTYYDASNCFICSLISTCTVEPVNGKHSEHTFEAASFHFVRIFFLQECQINHIFVGLKCGIGLDLSDHVVNQCMVSDTHALSNQPLDFHPCRHRLGAF